MPSMSEPSRAELKYTVQRQREELQSLNEVGRLLTTSTDPVELCQLVAGYLQKSFPIALFGVLLSRQRRLLLFQFATISETDIQQTVSEIIEASNPMLSSPLTDKEIEVSRIEGAGDGSNWAETPIREFRSRHASKISAEKNTVGVMHLFSGKESAFSEEDMHVFNTIADQLSAALHNSLLVEKLRRANQMKNDLLMVLTHELRTPITPIREGVNLLLDKTLGAVNAEQEEFLKIISDNTDRLSRLVERTLLASRILGEKLSLKIASTDIRAVSDRLNQAYRGLATEKSIQYTLPSPTPAFDLECDVELISIALGHLVENAIHATPKNGKVSVECSQQTGRVQIVVNDTGTGIPEEERVQLFDKFRLVGNVSDRKTGGLGLGLFIAHGIISAHAGTLELTDADEGTAAVVNLPLKASKE